MFIQIHVRAYRSMKHITYNGMEWRACEAGDLLYWKTARFRAQKQRFTVPVAEGGRLRMALWAPPTWGWRGVLDRDEATLKLPCDAVFQGTDCYSNLWAFPGGASDKEPAYQCRGCKRPEFDPWVGKIPWRRSWQPTPVFLPGESHGQRSLVGYSPWGPRESVTTEAT